MKKFLYRKRVVCSVYRKNLKFYGNNSSKDLTLLRQTLGDVCKMEFLKDFERFTGKHLYQILYFKSLQTTALLQKRNLVQRFSFEFCGIFKRIFFIELSSRRLLLTLEVYKKDKNVSRY